MDKIFVNIKDNNALADFIKNYNKRYNINFDNEEFLRTQLKSNNCIWSLTGTNNPEHFFAIPFSIIDDAVLYRFQSLDKNISQDDAKEVIKKFKDTLSSISYNMKNLRKLDSYEILDFLCTDKIPYIMLDGDLYVNDNQICI